MHGLKYIQPKNIGWLEKKLSSDEMKHLWDCINERGDKCNNLLAGVLEISNNLVDKNDWFWSNTLLPLCNEYANYFSNIGDTIPINETRPYFLEKFWVNFQNQNEFNPMHDHLGVYSFVVWMKVPTNHKEQNELFISKDANSDAISTFQFAYTDILGNIIQHTYEMNPEVEGTMLFFPSDLKHQVYPYYNCDEQRISVSGNISIKV